MFLLHISWGCAPHCSDYCGLRELFSNLEHLFLLKLLHLTVEIAKKYSVVDLHRGRICYFCHMYRHQLAIAVDNYVELNRLWLCLLSRFLPPFVFPLVEQPSFPLPTYACDPKSPITAIGVKYYVPVFSLSFVTRPVACASCSYILSDSDIWKCSACGNSFHYACGSQSITNPRTRVRPQS